MFKRMRALIWSRKEMILANKPIIVNIFMPFLLVLLYQFMYKNLKMQNTNEVILYLVSPMIPALIGYIMPTLVAEEAEKNNQRSLRLAGVKSWEYVLASLFFPFILNVLYMLLLPLYLEVKFADLGLSYVIIMLLTSLVVFLLFLMVALLTDTQARATILAMPVMMLTFLLPLFSMMDKGIEKFIAYTYMGAYTRAGTDWLSYQLTDKSFWILLIWLLLSLAGVIWATKHKQIIR